MPCLIIRRHEEKSSVLAKVANTRKGVGEQMNRADSWYKPALVAVILLSRIRDVPDLNLRLRMALLT
jgi:hypothetical protein